MIENKINIKCPYLDTISRNLIDFDFEKYCSTSMSPINVYACLVCGKYYQGRGKNTYVYLHCLEYSHHIFMNLNDGKVWCLPDGYEVEDCSLDDIRSLLKPTFTAKEIASLDLKPKWSKTIEGIEYMQGLVGLNNMGENDYINVVIQILARTCSFRDLFLNEINFQYFDSLLIKCTGELLKKIWHPKLFKGHVSPHEFMQAIITESNGMFLLKKRG